RWPTAARSSWISTAGRRARPSPRRAPTTSEADDVDRDIARRALAGLAGDARKTRVLDRLPKSAHPTGFMISIGMLPEGTETDGEAAHEAEVAELAGLDDDDLDLDE